MYLIAQFKGFYLCGGLEQTAWFSVMNLLNMPGENVISVWNNWAQSLMTH